MSTLTSPGLSRRLMALVFTLICAIIIYGLFISAPKQTVKEQWVTVTHSDPDAHNDLELYQAIAMRVESGDTYYSTAIEEQRARSYPVRPFFTVRLPTLAEIRALSGTSTASNTIIGLMFILLISLSWWAKMRPLPEIGQPQPIEDISITAAIAAMVLLVSGLTIYIGGNFLFMHEVWAGGLLAISLALYRPAYPWLAMAMAALALAIRETSLPFILLFFAYSAFQARWKEAVSWAVIIIVFGAGLAWHAYTVTALTNANDMASPGWATMGGWATYLTFMHDTTILRFFPLAITALLIPLCLAGWLGAKHVDGKLIFLFQAGYALIFMVMGRPDNYYWGFMVAPTLLMGLAFLPQFIGDMRQRWTEAAVSG